MQDEKYFNCYIEKYYTAWLHFATRLMRDRVKGSDLLSETIIKILENQREKAHQLAHEDKLNAYVLRSIYWMAIDKSSRYHTKYTKFIVHWSPEINVEQYEVDATWIGSRIDNEYLDSWIAMMPELDATILRIYMMQDFSYQDLSNRTGIPTKTLYKLVENALNKIKRNAKLPSTTEGT